MLGLPPIENLEGFSSQTRISKNTLYLFSKFGDSYYKTYTIPKKSGGSRLIAQPSRSLKAAQAWLLKNILESLKVSSSCKGFEKDTNIANNAKPHVGANAIMTLDIDNFFPSINANQVYTIYRTIGYSPKMAAIFTSTCTYKGALPQGGVCSPKLSNLVCLQLDTRIQGFVGKRGVVYTRYADDLSFSSLAPSRLIPLYPIISKILKDEGFNLNDAKTRISGPSRAKRVTGLIVTDKRVGIGRKKLHLIRAKIHQLSLQPSNTPNSNKEILHINGWLSYIKSVDKPRWNILSSYIKNLKDKRPTSLLSLL